MLRGRTVLVVEEEFLIALDVQRVLEGQNVAQTLLARTTTEALTSFSWQECALAVVEVIRPEPAAGDLLARLHAANIPAVLVTSNWEVVKLYAGDYPVLMKPVPEESLVSAIAAALT